MDYMQHLKKDKKLAQIVTDPLPPLALKSQYTFKTYGKYSWPAIEH